MKKYLRENGIGLLISIALTQLVGLLSILSSGDMKAYSNVLNKPPFAPPDWLFGVAWPILYLLLGIAVYLIYASVRRRNDRLRAIWYYAIQLLINVVWSVTVFRFHQIELAIGVLVILILLVLKTMQVFRRINVHSMRLMIPYMLWLLYALYLNVGIYLVN